MPGPGSRRWRSPGPSRAWRRLSSRYPLHLAGARAGGVHLGDGGNEGAVHAPVALDHVVREEAAGAELRDAQRQRAGAGASDLSR